MLLYEMPRAVLRGACLQYTIFPAVCYAFCSYLSENSSLMPLWARLRRGGEKDGAGRRSHGREAGGRPGWFRAAKCRARFRGDDCEICRWRYFLSVKKVTKERRGFAVGAPARRSRDGNGKIAVRGGEAMAAKRTTAQGGFAQRNAARDFARQTQKAGPVIGQRGSAAGEMEPNGGKHRFLRSENRDEIEEVKQNAMSLV